MGPLGIQETIVIFVLALLVFGPKKLPELGKTIGKAMTEFRRASNELKSTWSREMAAIEQEGESIRAETRKITDEIKSSYNDDTSGSHYDSEYSTADDSSNVGASATQGAESTASADSSVSTPPEGTVPSGSATSTDGTTSSKSDPEVEDVTTPAPGRTSAGSEAVTT